MNPLVIFDCDGVLVDSEGISNATAAAFYTGLGVPMSAAQCRARFMGMTYRAMHAAVEAERGEPLPDGALDVLRAQVAARLAAEVQIMPGARQLVDAVAAAGVASAVASSSGHAKLKVTLGRAGLLPHFEGRIFSGEDVARGKPAPDVYLLAARSMGREPAACVAIEDSPNGVRSAVAAGMRVVGFGAETPAGALIEAGADVVVRDLVAAIPLVLARAV